MAKKIFITLVSILVIGGGVSVVVYRNADSSKDSAKASGNATFPDSADKESAVDFSTEEQVIFEETDEEAALPGFANITDSVLVIVNNGETTTPGGGIAADAILDVSADGSKILFGRYYGDPDVVEKYNLFEYSSASDSVEQRTQDKPVHWARYAPDGTRAAYYTVNDNTLWLIDESGTHVALERAGDYYLKAVWSPDGTRIAYAQGTRSDDKLQSIYTRVAVRTISTGEVRELTDYSILSYPRAWSLDGSSLYYAHTMEEGDLAGEHLYRYVFADASASVVAAPEGQRVRDFVVFANGNLLYTTAQGDLSGDMYISEADGADARKIGIGYVLGLVVAGERVLVGTPTAGDIVVNSAGETVGSFTEEYLDNYGQWRGAFFGQ